MIHEVLVSGEEAKNINNTRDIIEMEKILKHFIGSQMEVLGVTGVGLHISIQAVNQRIRIEAEITEIKQNNV